MSSRRGSGGGDRHRPSAHAIPGRHPVREALRAGREIREVLVDSRTADGSDLEDLVGMARAAGISVRTVDRDALDEAAGGVRSQGIVAITPPFRTVGLRAVLDGDLLVVADGITDPQNLGAIARTAEQAGARALVVPAHRAAMVTPAVEKAAAGALSWLAVAEVPGIPAALTAIEAAGIWRVGLDASGEPLWDCGLLDERVAIVVGAEGRGLGRLTAERCDALVAIPTRGCLDSLNASAAAAVVCFETVRRRR